MKLLFDENLSVKLVSRLASDFPGSVHPELLKMRATSDQELWKFARAQDFVIVTKDSDFRHLAVVRGPPPKVIWLRLGNQGTNATVAMLQTHKPSIEQFAADQESGLLVIGA
jgi:predicted nuclease of predicted toxin-antitoxin system